MSESFCCDSEMPMRSGTDIPSFFRGRAGARTAHEDLWHLSYSLKQVSLSTRLWLQTGVRSMTTSVTSASLGQWIWDVDSKQLPWHAAALQRCSIFYLPLSGVLNKTTDVQVQVPQLLWDILLRAAWQWSCACLIIPWCLDTFKPCLASPSVYWELQISVSITACL